MGGRRAAGHAEQGDVTLPSPTLDRPDPAEGIGKEIATRRVARGMRVSDLARTIGVSPSLVSQIEKGRTRPSVSTLFAIAEALHVSIDSFFRQPPKQPGHGEAPVTEGAHELKHAYIVRMSERAVIEIEGGVRWERLTAEPLSQVEFLELIYDPGAESSPRLYRHPGIEMLVMLSGELEISLGFDSHVLRPGDSMNFPSMVPHRYINKGSDQARAITTIMHSDDV